MAKEGAPIAGHCGPRRRRRTAVADATAAAAAAHDYELARAPAAHARRSPSLICVGRRSSGRSSCSIEHFLVENEQPTISERPDRVRGEA